ncbi:HAMP domain-containing sensor histidine kinase [Pontibacter sp. SGAir0037]|uniref:sensor histidine kinase n=1 Tax=Pontibacter sp. SGAir0037 TaxID=2571030 RepID=UPI0010CD531A|nr:HAMP domain-containing sensor histidine kinase [Pontibacter sp. SGAir0037]QCR24802.1 histidine kinase [Pontibacter sp. SGAir0037]
MHYNLPALIANKDSQTVQAAISKRINHIVDEAKAEAKKIGSQLNGGGTISFSHLLKKSKYPTFVYEKGQLVFWSDHTVVPDLDFPPVVDRPAALSNSFGTFIVVPHRERAYQLLIYIPLQIDYRISNDYLTSGLQQHIFQNTQAKLVLDPRANYPQVRTNQGDFLFALDLKSGRKQTGHDGLKLFLLASGIAFYIAFSALWSNRLLRKEKFTQGAFLLLSLLLLLRLALLALNLPFAIAEIRLFDPRLYAASFWSPSVGDLALNMLLLATVAWASLYLFNKNQVASQLKTISKRHSRYLQLNCIVIFYILLLLLFKFYHGIYHNSPLSLDISQTLDITKYKIILLGTIFVHAGSLCVFAYILSTVLSVLISKEPKMWPYQLLGAVAALFIVIVVVLQVAYLISIIITGVVFWLAVMLSAQHRSAVSFTYRIYLFLLLVMAVSAFTGAIALYTHYQKEILAYKQNFASNLLQGNDVLAEYMLEEDVSRKIAHDGLIKMKMMGPYVDAAFIKRKISKQYLRDYFDKYETNVLLFDSEGRTLVSADTTASTLQELINRYDKPLTRTERKNLFLINDPTKFNARMYLKIIEIPLGNRHLGTIVLQLTLKKLLPHSVVPELLVDQKNSQLFRTDFLSYAIYEKNQLVYSEGEYDYATNFNKARMQSIDLYRQGITQDNSHHLGVQDADGKVLVITTENYGGREILSNFSFLFLSFTFGLICCLVVYLLFNRQYVREFSPNFSTKIQLFLNFGILLPLLLVSITTASLVTSSYKKDLMMTYEQRGESVQQNLSSLLRTDGLLNRRLLQSKVTDVASISETDINLYDRHGRLVVTSQPMIFEAGLLSKLVNPAAFAAVSERQALRVLLDEKAGSLTFNALYMPLRDNSTQGELQGFIGIPFFDSEKELESKLIELITTTMNIFTIMFMVFILLTFFASRALTVPLRMLTEKLKRTSLAGKNEMLLYKGADEIGMLVNEYNRMLLTLEQNKVDLAMREKEAAWREMARQVAHEIKNPLTPMKLSLQYLQKAIAEKKPNTEQLIDKISHTLITQINILSDIATSFSNFTSMPEPKAEPMNLAAALQQAADLHNDPATAVILKDIPAEEVIVLGDESLIVRTFNNLLLNAIQAVPASRKPHLKVALEVQQEGRTALVTIKDNGSGIPAEIRNKVFIPNFSTKYTGSGIGLAVAKKGIESAGGQIWFDTEEGKGTTFFISLPLASV